MKTAKTPAAANGKAASPASTTAADRAFLEDGRRFLATLRAAAKSAGVPLDEFLLRAAFESERGKQGPEKDRSTAPFIRAAVRHNAGRMSWTGDAIVGHATCDMRDPRKDGSPQRRLPRAFAFAPEGMAKDDSRWLSYEEFYEDHGLAVDTDRLNVQHAHTLREEENGTFSFRLVGTEDETRYPADWAPVSVACWFFGLEPAFVNGQIKAGRLLKTTGAESLVNLQAISELLARLNGRGAQAFAEAGAVENSFTRVSRHLRRARLAAAAAA